MILEDAIETETYVPQDLNVETRQRLEKAVLEIFSETDFHRANIRDVAKKAGVSFTSIYKYYGNKEGLLFATLDNVLGRLTERLTDHLQGISDLKEKLRKAFWVELDFYERHPEVGRIIFLTVPFRKWMEDKSFRQKKFINTYIEVIRDGQSLGLLNNDVKAGVLLDFIHGMIHHRFAMWIFRGQKERFTQDAGQVFEMIWRAICRPSDTQN